MKRFDKYSENLTYTAEGRMEVELKILQSVIESKLILKTVDETDNPRRVVDKVMELSEEIHERFMDNWSNGRNYWVEEKKKLKKA